MDESGEGGALRSMAAYLAGPAEIAEHLGIRPNTINQWKVRHSDFPTPVRKLRSGEIWDIREVHAWAVRTGRLVAASTDATSLTSAASSLARGNASDYLRNSPPTRADVAVE